MLLASVVELVSKMQQSLPIALVSYKSVNLFAISWAQNFCLYDCDLLLCLDFDFIAEYHLKQRIRFAV